VPYYQAQPQLDLVLAALSSQTHPATRLEVVVADDGSATAPDLTAAAGLASRLVRQPDQGFRAAAARNLGAAVAGGDVLLFLDGDTVPEPAYVQRLVRLPALAPDAVVAGRRRHADLTGWDPERLVRWLGEDGPGPVELTEPEWLRAGYTASRDLLDADERSYRFVISAVCGLARDLFTELGGFDPDFTGYGGEDWELAHRAWVGGALLAHVPEAVAWHDGADWADRDKRARGAKNAETRRLAAVLPDPVARGGGQWLPYPAIVVTVPDEGPDATLATARWAFRGDTDCGIWVAGPTAADTVAQLADPRIRSGAVPDGVRARAQAVVELTQPARLEDLSGLVAQALRLGPLAGPAGTVTAQRARRRADRWTPALDLDLAMAQAWLFGGRDAPVPRRFGAVDLAHELKYVGQ
jgi:GT2 family glycosyltransferase